jgi:nucleotide-binding universal stress UspA family protein
MFETILVPLDGSKLAEAVLSQVRKVLFRKDAEVILVRAVSVPSGTEGTTPELMESLQIQATWYLEEQAQILHEQGVRVRTILRVGDPARVILDAASRTEADLIAMTTHGRSGLRRWAFGSVAERVIRASKVPVLALRSFTATGAEAPRRDLTLNRILVPISDADLSLNVIEPAIELAQLFGASVRVLHVCEGGACTMPVPQITRAFERFRDAGIGVEPLMKEGDAAAQVLDACAETESDLIAMTTHGRAGLSRWMLGSVTEKILRASKVPMLIVRPKAADASSGTLGRSRTA